MTKGMLIVMTNPPAAMEEEFNAWYDDEHVPERMSVPGFEHARRYYVTHAERRYIALYDMASIEVLDTAPYYAVSGDHASPWTKLIVPRCNFIRVPTVQVYPGEALTSRAPRVLMLRFADGGAKLDRIVEISKRSFAAAQVQQLRVFRAEENDDVYVMVEGHLGLETLVRPELYEDATPLLDIINLYASC
jgi:hypothetical protein